jgi:hypothetical protein
VKYINPYRLVMPEDTDPEDRAFVHAIFFAESMRTADHLEIQKRLRRTVCHAGRSDLVSGLRVVLSDAADPEIIEEMP